MKYSRIFTTALTGTVFTLLSLQTFAGPGTLINSPLFVSATAKPNIMILTDTSGSMRHVVPEDALGADANKYNSTTTYIANCGAATVPDAVEDAGTDNLYIRIIGGQPEISINSITGGGDPLGTTGGTVCFDSTKNYNASLNADGGTSAAGSATALYSGNYLNWYFNASNTTPNWNSWQELKPGTDYRMNITKTTINTIVDGLNDSVRFGIATLNGGAGATIDEPIQTLTPAFKTTIQTTVNGLSQSGTTPMAEALHQVGRYFMGDDGTNDPGNLPVGSTLEANGQTTGTGANQLELHPGTASAALYNRGTVFPTMAAGGNVESPIQYWCQNNFVIFMSDGISRSDLNIPVNGDSSATPVIQPTILADYDNDCVGNVNCDIDNDQKSTGSYIYDIAGSDYLDDVAQALFELDLRPDIDDNDGNEVVNNIRTYTIAFADQDALNNKLLDDAAAQGGGEYFTSATASELANDFSKATSSILARTSSASAVTFNTSTLGSDTAIYQAQFSTARWSGEIYSFPIEPSTGNILFNCTFDAVPNCWQASPRLDALAYNNASSTFVDNRQIITFDSATQKGIAFKTPVDFTAPAADELTTSMINDLCAGPDAPLVSGLPCTSATTAAKTASQTYVQNIVNYVRGDRTYESISNSPTFRTRQSVLGDIINANPTFIGVPSLRWPSQEAASNRFGATGNRYSDFKTAQANRTTVLYVAANDGMMHAFRTKTAVSPGIGDQAGDEIFAFIPGFIYSNQLGEGLHYLAKPTYTHKYYLDLSPTFSDVYGRGKDTTQADFRTTTNDWRTVLIGGSRGGVKKGIFALDVTDPLTITESNAVDKILWEFTDSDDADLGYTYSKPTIALTNAVGADGLNRWAAIFGNGYQDDNGSGTFPTGASCTAVLYILFLDGGLDGTWTLGTNPSTADYIKIDTTVGTTTAGNCNGLSTPALADTDGDQILDRVYAGDVQGNMWAFDLTCSGASCGTNDFDVAYTTGTTPRPLFTAQDAAGNAQPIMVKPALARNIAESTSASNQPNLLVLFGTGQYHVAGDNIGTSKINSFYGIWDSGTGQLTDNRANNASAGSTLVGQFLTTNTTPFGFVRTITTNLIDWSNKYGWYIDLSGENPGSFTAEERVVVKPVLRSRTLFFNTLLPNSQVCGSGGNGWLMSVNFNTGGAPSNSIVDVNNDNIVDASDRINGNVAVGTTVEGIPASSSFIGTRRYTQTSRDPDLDGAGGGGGGGGSPPSCTPNVDCGEFDPGDGPKEGRLSWRELRSED